MKKIIYLALILSCAFIMGCSPATQSMTSSTTTTFAGPTASISIAFPVFTPNSLTIESGTTVIWTNNDSFVHTVVSETGPASFNSGTINPGTTFPFQFTTLGKSTYHCTIHPSMTGTITVK